MDTAESICRGGGIISSLKPVLEVGGGGGGGSDGCCNVMVWAVKAESGKYRFLTIPGTGPADKKGPIKALKLSFKKFSSGYTPGTKVSAGRTLSPIRNLARNSKFLNTAGRYIYCCTYTLCKYALVNTEYYYIRL